ncbi:MAG: type VI secretion system ATPase TssH [Deltaproteobacteria bacterium]|nr:type VI secretion system ATPase TssH [Deltaproteobacteria bacterium]
MLGADVRKLIGKLSEYSTSLLDQAAGFCLVRGHYEITVEHFLLKTLEDGGNDVHAILERYGIDGDALQKRLLKALESFESGSRNKPSFSLMLINNIQEAWTLASVNLDDRKIRTGHMLYALLNNPGYISAHDYGVLLEDINLQELGKKFGEIVASSSEHEKKHIATAGKHGELTLDEDSFLARYTTNFTQMAETGAIDPVYRRDREIREMIDILGRRRKNNPICVGDPGVGKSAVVEGLALRIVHKEVPSFLQGVTVLGLDMGMLQAGAGVKGEFEKRLKGIIDEVKLSEGKIVLFIDEAHTMIGAGGPSGGADAANLLKPALARGELRTIASTTWSEYKKYFEKDAALARRFQLVKVDEPSVAYAIDIVRGIKDKYEHAHGVSVLDDAVTACVSLSDRYISGRQLPDKAIDLLDTACARIKINLTSKPAALDDIERDMESTQRTIDALTNVLQPTDEQNEVLNDAKAKMEAFSAEAEKVASSWEKEKELVERILHHKSKGDESEERKAREKLRKIVGDNPGMVHPEVDYDTICSVITDWTGIPLSKMIADEADTVLKMESLLSERVKGQEWGISVLAQTIRASKANIKPLETPVGCCLLVGPSGVGKTETALAIADLLYGGERFVTTINMSEFQEKHTVSRLIGSPPGYVGYGEGGYLTEALRRSPYSLVLIDETEKAHPDVLNIFYQVFDKGVLFDGEGRQIDCRNALFILTSNLATNTITELSESPVRPEMDELISAIRPELSSFFKPALLARMTIVPYLTLSAEVLQDVAKLKLNKLVRRVFDAQRIILSYNNSVIDEIVARCTEVETGARAIDQILAQHIMPNLSNQILEHMIEKEKEKNIVLEISNGEFICR